MVLDIEEENKKIIETMKKYNFSLGKRTHFKIFDFRHPLQKKKYKNTLYYYFNALIISRDTELIPFGNHTIQLPSKRVVSPLYLLAKDKKVVNSKEIAVTILKEGKNKFNITIHT